MACGSTSSRPLPASAKCRGPADISTNSIFKILFFNFGGKASEWVKACGAIGGNNPVADRLVTGKARGDAVKSLLDPGAFMEKVSKGSREVGVTPIVRVPAGRGDGSMI